MEVRDGNGLNPKSRNCLWVSSLNASVAFLIGARSQCFILWR
jgi:hypothetical protein